MKSLTNTVLFLIMLTTATPLLAKDIPFTQEDRDRLIRVEAKLEAMDKRFEDINKRFEDTNKRFEDINAQMGRMSATFTALVIAVIGFAIWDRRTMVRPFERKVKDIEDEIAENRSKLHTLLEALRTLGRKNDEVAEILKKFNLL